MASGSRFYYTPGSVTEWHTTFALILKLAVFNHLDPVNTNYVQFFDRVTAPPPGEPALASIAVYPGGVASYTPAMDGREFVDGLCIALSSTPDTYTAVGGTLLNLFVEGRQP